MPTFNICHQARAFQKPLPKTFRPKSHKLQTKMMEFTNYWGRELANALMPSAALKMANDAAQRYYAEESLTKVNEQIRRVAYKLAPEKMAQHGVAKPRTKRCKPGYIITRAQHEKEQEKKVIEAFGPRKERK